jgi:hypothetical protein
VGARWLGGPRGAADQSAPRSAIMIVGALVLVEVTLGITEASTILSPLSPCMRCWSSTTVEPFCRS